MSGNGWIKLHRKFSEKGYYQRSQYVHLWVHCLLKANHKEKEYMTNGKIIVIRAGQFVTGRKQLSRETGIPESTVEDILSVFEREEQIQQQKNTKYRLVTIVNWGDYQESDSKATAKQQQADTNKNDKKEKNDKNTDSLRSSDVPLEKIEVPDDSEAPVKAKADPLVEKAAKYWQRLCQDEIGLSPSGGLPKTMRIIKDARKELTFGQIHEMMVNWFEEQSLEPHEMIQITRCLSNFQIDKFKAENV